MRVLAEFGFLRGGFSFFRAQLHGCDQAAEVLVAGAVFYQQRVAAAGCRGDFRSDVRAHSGFLRGHVEARCAADVVGIHQGHGRDFQAGAFLDEIFRGGGTFQEAEGRAAVEFGVHQS